MILLFSALITAPLAYSEEFNCRFVVQYGQTEYQAFSVTAVPLQQDGDSDSITVKIPNIQGKTVDRLQFFIQESDLQEHEAQTPRDLPRSPKKWMIVYLYQAKNWKTWHTRVGAFVDPRFHRVVQGGSRHYQPDAVRDGLAMEEDFFIYRTPDSTGRPSRVRMSCVVNNR